MMKDTEHLEVGATLGPLPDCVRVADTGIVDLQPRQVDAVLQRELDVRVVQLEGFGEVAFGEVVAVQPDRALPLRRVGFPCPVDVVEIYVVRVVRAGGMLRESNYVMV